MLQCLNETSETSSHSVLLFLISSDSTFDRNRKELLNAFAGSRLFLCVTDCVHRRDVWTFVHRLRKMAADAGLRQATLVAEDAGASAAQALAAFDSRFVRRLVLLRPTCRVRPSLTRRIVDAIEHALPLGLPLRQTPPDFDSRPFLHRITCPTLIVDHVNSPQSCDSRKLAAAIPNAWNVSLLDWSSSDALKELLEIIRQFREVPAKRPQKSLRQRA